MVRENVNIAIQTIKLGSGEIEFEEFAAMVANFVVNSEDNEGLEEELREAFRLYDKEVDY